MKVRIHNNIVDRWPKFTNTAYNFIVVRMKDLRLDSAKQSTSASSSSSSAHHSMKQLLPACPDLDPSQRSDREHFHSRESLSACSQSSKFRTPSPPKRETREVKVSPTSNNRRGKTSSRRLAALAPTAA